MRKVNLIALAMLTIYLGAPLALGQGGTVEQKMTALNDQVKEANLKGDVSFFEKYYADDVVIVHSDGKISTKAQELDSWKSGAIKYETFDVRELKISVHGDTAVVTALISSNRVVNGKPTSGDARGTRVWMKEKGEWKMVAFQATSVK
jgi:ketosteroid isomerase-like protein